jgi:hypothetical protein
MKRLLRGWARLLLDDELTAAHKRYAELTENYRMMIDAGNDLGRDVVQLTSRNRYLETKLRQTEESERHQRAAANGAALLRLEHELLGIWRTFAATLEAEPIVDADGSQRCVKVPLHSRKEAARFAKKVERDVNYPEGLEPYVCTICPPHLLVGRVWHVRHERDSPLRRLTSTDRAALRAGEPLSTSILDRVPPDVREQLTRRLANDNGPSDWSPDGPERPLAASDGIDSANVGPTGPAEPSAAEITTFVPAIGTFDGTTERTTEDRL